MKIAFTICSNNYLAQAKTLGDSLIKYNPDYKIYICLVDVLSDKIDYSFFWPHSIIPIHEIKIPDFESLCEKYNIVELNTVVKPFFFNYLFENYNPSFIIFLDPDIAVFNTFSEIEKLFDDYNILLTPHLLFRNEKIAHFEQLILNVGIFNLGFLGLTHCTETESLLKWLSVRLNELCYIDFENGLFVDQIWANYFPVLFEKVCIIKNPGLNMGYWNFSERSLSTKDGVYFVNSDYNLIFFHFSSFNPTEKSKLCKWLEYSFEERPDLFEIYNNYAEAVLKNNFIVLSKINPMINFRDNHPNFKFSESLSLWQKLGIKINSISTKIIKKIFSLYELP